MPFGRMAQPSDTANLCAFLASEAGEHISGQIIYVDASQDRKPTQEFFSSAAEQRSGI